VLAATSREARTVTMRFMELLSPETAAN